MEKKVNTNNSHEYDYILVLDFEATCEENVRLNPQEIIEFPVVVYDLNKNQVWTDNIFHYYIKPSVNPKLTNFCKNLTKITQEQVDNGLYLQDAIKKLVEYLQNTGIDKSKYAFLTCGDFDFKCLMKECKAKKIPYPECMRNYINVKRIYPQNLIKKSKGFADMVGMLEGLNLKLDGTHHSGIDDSKNIAKIAHSLVNDCGITLTQSMSTTPQDWAQKQKESYRNKAKQQNINSTGYNRKY